METLTQTELGINDTIQHTDTESGANCDLHQCAVVSLGADQIEEHANNNANPSDRYKLDNSEQSGKQNNNINSNNTLGDLNNFNRALSNVDHLELRLLVRRCEAGALIGKRGSNIKRLRDTFRTSKISIPDTGNGPERIVCLSIDKPDFDAILTDLSNVLLEKSFEDSGQIEIKLLIHSSHAGSLIGIGGQSIKKLRNESKAAIKIYEMCCPLSSERVCAVKSKPPVVVRTVKLILDILSDNPIKGTIKLYDALNFDPSLVDKYGGCLDDCVASFNDFPTTSSNAFVNTLTNQANLCMKHHTCRSAPFNTIANQHHDQNNIITDAMPIQVAPIIYRFRASPNKQTFPMNNARGISLMNQQQQYYDSYQSKPFNGALHGTNRILANPFRLQPICRPIHSQRFHPYLFARYPETKSYQQVRPSNMIFKFNRQVPNQTTRPVPNQTNHLQAQSTAGSNQQTTPAGTSNIDIVDMTTNDVSGAMTASSNTNTIMTNESSLKVAEYKD